MGWNSMPSRRFDQFEHSVFVGEISYLKMCAWTIATAIGSNVVSISPTCLFHASKRSCVIVDISNAFHDLITLTKRILF